MSLLLITARWTISWSVIRTCGSVPSEGPVVGAFAGWGVSLRYGLWSVVGSGCIGYVGVSREERRSLSPSVRGSNGAGSPTLQPMIAVTAVAAASDKVAAFSSFDIR